MSIPSLHRRAAGVLLHFTSLPGPYGSGDLGDEAHRFVEFLSAAGQRYWQVLPVQPPGGGASPYQTISSFAGHSALVSIDALIREGLVTADFVRELVPKGDDTSIDFVATSLFRDTVLRAAFREYARTHSRTRDSEFDAFVRSHDSWLEDYALYVTLKTKFGGVAWTAWPEPLRTREPRALAEAAAELYSEMEFQRFVQFKFAAHFQALRDACHAHGIGLIGDVPIFVAHDSADVWANQELFFLDADGHPTVVAGVPPDAFSDTGQRWGNALYQWEALRATGYKWWIERMRISAERFDAVRLDHFIGFVRYWEIPAQTEDARQGTFRPGPGRPFFDALRVAIPDIQLIAEDLGIVTDEVHALRDGLALPGMRVLQFVFGTDEGSRAYQPHAFPKTCVVYTGTHDNNTTRGWFDDPRAANDAGLRASHDFAKLYTRSDGRSPEWDMICCAYQSVANTAVIPLQDFLALGAAARMNTPGTVEGNWRWRFRWDQVAQDLAGRMRTLSETYSRFP